jgi:hypothetical protein
VDHDRQTRRRPRPNRQTSAMDIAAGLYAPTWLSGVGHDAALVKLGHAGAR